MSETEFWQNIVRPQLQSFGELERIENAIKLGTPDVAYALKLQRSDEVAAQGWAELKYLREWPKRYETIVKFKHYTLDQVNFAERWHRCGARACMLAQIENDFMIVPAWNMRKIFNGVNKATFISLAEVHGHKVFPTGRILRWLTE